MTKIYAFAQITVHDPHRYKSYEDRFMAILGDHGGRLAGFAEPPAVIEGAFESTRAVLLEFESRGAFDIWYGSKAYQEIIGHRLAASQGTVLVIDALE